jgi:hypothetical protein
MDVLGKVARVPEVQLGDATRQRPSRYPLIHEHLEKSWKQGDDIEAHAPPS